MPKLVPELVISERGVQRDDDAAHAGRGEEGYDPFGPVWQVDRYAVPRLHTQARPCTGERGRLTVDLLVRQPSVFGYDAFAAWVLLYHSGEAFRQMVPHQIVLFHRRNC